MGAWPSGSNKDAGSNARGLNEHPTQCAARGFVTRCQICAKAICWKRRRCIFGANSAFLLSPADAGRGGARKAIYRAIGRLRRIAVGCRSRPGEGVPPCRRDGWCSQLSLAVSSSRSAKIRTLNAMQTWKLDEKKAAWHGVRAVQRASNHRGRRPQLSRDACAAACGRITVSGSNNNVAGANQLILSADYFLSKRTDVYLVGTLAHDHGFGTQAEAAMGASSNTSVQTAVRIAIRHKF